MDTIKIVCRALVMDDQKRALFVKKTGSDFWSLPGGMLNTDDTSVQVCLIRELQEELGVEAEINDIRFVHELHKASVRYVELIWHVSLASDPMQTQEDIYTTSGGELSDMQWIAMGDLSSANIKPEFLKNIT